MKMLEMFEEANGGTSSMRIVYVAFMGLFTVGYFINCIRSGQMVDVPWNVVAIIAALASAKVVQRSVEKEQAQ